MHVGLNDNLVRANLSGVREVIGQSVGSSRLQDDAMPTLTVDDPCLPF